MSLDEIAPIPNDPVEPEAAPATEPAAEPAHERDEPAEPQAHEDPAERLRRAERALERMNRERREAREELERERLIRKELTEQFQALRPKPQQPEAEADVEPDPQADPEGWLRWNFAQARQAAEEVKAWKKAQQEAAKQQDEVKALMSDTVRDYAAFADEEAPDFHEAYAFIEKGLREHYENTPFFDGTKVRLPTKAEVDQQLATDEANFVRHVRAAGYRPAAAVYEIAQLKGYKRNVAAQQLVEGDRRRADAERVRGLPAAAPSSTGDGMPTYEWVVENSDSTDPKVKAKVDKWWGKLDELPRKR